MSRYETYKPSGIDWIGNYPKHWEFRRLKNVCIVNKEALTDKTPFDYLIEYIDIGNTTDNGEFLELQEIEFSEAPSRARRKVEDGDTIISTVRTYLRAIAFIENPKENLIVSTGFAVLNPIKRTLVPKFLFYQVLCDSFIQRVIANSEGVSYPAISSTKLADLKLFIPSVEEQLTIANYLDDHTQKIDRLIANKKAQAEKLKELRQIEINNAVTKGLNPNAEMKDSGIKWLGNIPKHWEVKRLKNILLNINSGDGISNDELVEDGEVEVYGGNGVMGYTDKFNSDGKVIIIGRVGAKCGVVYLVDKKIWISDNALKSRTYQNYEFVYYLIDAMNLNNYANQNAQPLITGGILKGLYAALPPKNEQAEIANFLKQRTTAIDQLIKNIEAQIEKLQELRKIKIYEAVTGKIKVNAYAETTA